MRKILLTGGAGFIGSHTCIELLNSGFEIIILDSFFNSSEIVEERLKALFFYETNSSNINLSVYKGDIRDNKFVENIFLNAINVGKPIDAVIHCAGLKSVRESFIHESKYFDVNVNGSYTLLQNMRRFNCKKIVFSSSASLYDSSLNCVCSEDNQIKPNSPYAKTKESVEKILYDFYNDGDKQKWEIINLRYFNPAGSHPSGMIGEDPNGIPNNLFPFITQVASGRREFLEIFGNDWPTKDGTGVRDYIHIMDLARAHRLALNHLFESYNIYLNINIGSGTEVSVLELIDIFEKENNCSIPYKIKPKRRGDVPKLIADNSQAKKILNWQPAFTINDICKHGWNWLIKNPNGYENISY